MIIVNGLRALGKRAGKFMGNRAIGRKKPPGDNRVSQANIIDSGHEMSSGTQHSTSKDIPYQAMGIAEDVFIHPSSVLANASPPDFVVYLEVVRTSRVWIKGKFRRLSDNRIDFNHALGQD